MRMILLPFAVLLALSACSVPRTDIAAEQAAMDQALIDARQAQLRNAGLEPAPGATIGTGAPIVAAGDPFGPGTTGTTGPLATNDLAARAEGAIAAAEAGQPAAAQGGVFDNLQPQQASDVLPAPLIPRVAAFAIRTTHSPGERQWRRNPLRRAGQISCTAFESRDLAQDRFLAEGGPDRDPLGLDPDGDGFVCGFDPRALRSEAAGTGGSTGVSAGAGTGVSASVAPGAIGEAG